MSFTNEELRTAMDCLQHGSLATARLSSHKVDWSRLCGAYVALGGCAINRREVARLLERGCSETDKVAFSANERAVIEAVLAEMSL